MYIQSKKRNAMGLSVIPTNIGGVNIPLAQLQGPLSKLFQDQSSQNLMFPSDLATNPSMGHAVFITVHDYTSGFVGDASKLASVAGEAGTAMKNSLTSGDSATTTISKAFVAGTTSVLNNSDTPSIANYFTAKQYNRTALEKSLANISLFMPDTLVAQHDPQYQEVNMTEVLGLKGYLGNAYQDFSHGGGLKSLIDNSNTLAKSDYAKYAGSQALDIANKSSLLGGGGAGLGAVAQQAMGSVSNPQVQLLFKGVGLRTFTLEFLMTPKNAQEAAMVKDIVDAFTFYSLPGFAGGADGKSGQFLTPPQIFKIKFKFLGGNGILDNIKNSFQSAMNNIGLGFLTSQNPSDTVKNANDAKIMSIRDCVLENMSVDYAPNGWAAYNDGYGIQTRLNLTFKEMSIMTKSDVQNNKIQNNTIAQGLGFDNIQGLNDAADPTSPNFMGI
jgi:hypothetical protein